MMDRHASRLNDIAARGVICLPQGAAIGEAAHLMAQHRISSVVVIDAAHHPLGILTEASILHAMRTGHAPQSRLHDEMLAPVVVMAGETDTLSAYQTCMHKGIQHLVLVDDQGALSGIVSETDFRRHMGLTLLAGRRRVAAVACQSVITLAPADMLLRALELMQSQRETCVVVVENGKPAGIVTQRDMVALYTRQPALADVAVAQVMTSPVLTIPGEASINSAAELMLARGVRHLVTVDEAGNMSGLVSEHDLTQTMAIGLLEEKEAYEDLFLRTFIDTIPELVWLKDETGVYRACNARFAQFVGVGEAEIIGRSDGDFIEADKAALFCAHDRQALEQDGPVVNDEWLTFAQGGYRGLFETIRMPMRNRHGDPVGVLGVARDITERHRAEENLRLIASVFGNSREAILITDAAHRIVEVNPAFSQITGYQREEVLGRDPDFLAAKRQKVGPYDGIRDALRKDGAWRGEVWNRRKSGEVYAGLLSVSAICDDAGNVQRHVAVLTDISYLKEHEAALARAANRDALTDLPNRRLLGDRLEQAMARVQRHGRLLAVCYVDLDGFKQVNDNYGHETGDRLLVGISHRLHESLRAGDTLARLGGDEFIMLFGDLAGREECIQILDRCMTALVMPMQIDGRELSISASIGVVFYPDDEADGETLLAHADQAMYAAKQGGRDRYCIYSAGDCG